MNEPVLLMPSRPNEHDLELGRLVDQLARKAKIDCPSYPTGDVDRAQFYPVGQGVGPFYYSSKEQVQQYFDRVYFKQQNR